MARNDVQPDHLIERALSDISAKTRDLEPDPLITDRIVGAAKDARPAGDPLAGIARATRSLEAEDALADSIMARISTGPVSVRRAPLSPSWLDGVVRTGPAAIGLAAFAAAASFLLFLWSERDINTTLASSIDTVEVSE